MSERGPQRRLGAVYRTEVTDAHVGRRVTIRHVIDTPDGQQPTDVVGHLRAWDDNILTVERRDGSTARVPAERIIASRLVPDVSPRARE
jgi:hypothetical protein